MTVALEDVEGMLDSLKGGLASLSSPLDDIAGKWRSLKENMTAAVVAGKQGRDELGHFTNASTGLAANCDKAAAAIRGIGTAATAIAFGAIPSASSAFTSVGHVLGDGITSACDSAAAGLSKLGPEGEAAGIAIQALGVVASATVGTLMTLMGIAVEVTEAIGMMASRTAALAGSAAGGAAVTAMVSKLSGQLPFATAQINQWADALIRAGVKGKDLESATRAIAAAAALHPEGGAEAATAAISKLAAGGKEADAFLKQMHEGGGRANKMLREMGLEMKDLGGQAAVSKMNAEQLQAAITKALIKKGAGPLDEMMSSFPVILQKAQEGFKSLFSGLGPAVKPFMAAIKALFGEFSKGGSATKGLKPIVTGFLTSVFSVATKVVAAITAVVKAFADTGKPGPLMTMVAAFKAVFMNAMLLRGIKAIFVVIGVVILSVVGIIGVLGAVFAFVASIVLDAVGVISTVVGGIASAIADAVSAGVAALSGLTDGAGSAASNFVSGLVDGIAAGASQVIAAVMGLASGALSAFTGVLGIHSPSTVMVEHGEDNIAGAAASGIDAGAPAVAKASARMADGAKPGKGGKGKGGGGGGDGRAITFTNCSFFGTTEDKIRQIMQFVLEEDAASAGAQGEAT